MIGLIGKKLGMTQIFGDDERVIPVTVIEANPNWIVRRKTTEKDRYNACILGAGVKRNPSKPETGVFKSLRRRQKPAFTGASAEVKPLAETDGIIKPTAILREIRDPPPDWEEGKKITVAVFSESKVVNVIAHSKGRGFAGVVKRYGWAGGPKSHGSKFHARPGSIGTSKTPGRVVKGHPLPGRMGGKKVTQRNVPIIKLDESKNLLFLKGQVPGSKNSWVLVKCK